MRQPMNFTDDTLFDSAITSGVGDAPEKINPDVAESLHSADESISWSPQRDPHEMGNLALNAREDLSSTSPELGKIVNLEMPPDANMPGENHESSPTFQAELNPDIIDFSKIRKNSIRDTIAPENVEIVEHAIGEFKKDKITPADLVDSIQKASDSFLDVNYGRKYGEAA